MNLTSTARSTYRACPWSLHRTVHPQFPPSAVETLDLWVPSFAQCTAETAGQKPWGSAMWSFCVEMEAMLLSVEVPLLLSSRGGVVRPSCRNILLSGTRLTPLPIELPYNSSTRIEQSSDLHQDAPPCRPTRDANEICCLTAHPGCRKKRGKNWIDSENLF